MSRIRWHTMTTPPTKNGRYWVYPYRSLDGQLYVTMASFDEGKWISSRPQEFVYWRRIEIPEAPRGKV